MAVTGNLGISDSQLRLNFVHHGFSCARGTRAAISITSPSRTGRVTRAVLAETACLGLCKRLHVDSPGGSEGDSLSCKMWAALGEGFFSDGGLMKAIMLLLLSSLATVTAAQSWTKSTVATLEFPFGSGLTSGLVMDSAGNFFATGPAKSGTSLWGDLQDLPFRHSN
jgi:hypothetical protein